MSKVRPITEVDRMLGYQDRLDRATGERVKARRRTRRKFGQLEVVVVETANEPTRLFLSNGSFADIVEATPAELEKVAAAVRVILADPPPIRRKRT